MRECVSFGNWLHAQPFAYDRGLFFGQEYGAKLTAGERWFRDCLVDFDLASYASWQWVAGCGTDAAPYFRIFNPVAQGERFDVEGQFTKKYVPELAQLPKIVF